MKVLVVSTYDTAGGAARAAFRLCEALNEHGSDCRMAVLNKTSDAAFVRSEGGLRAKVTRKIVHPHLGRRLEGLQKTANENLHNLALFGTGIVDAINRSDADVVNLHWVHGEMLSVHDYMRIRKPVVWTLHDMWAFCGAEHYVDDEPGARWRGGYSRFNRDQNDRGLDLNRWVWERKRRCWQKKLNLVTPSRWLADCCRESDLLGDWPVEAIANPLDLDTFRPWPKEVARRALKLPLDKKLILFGAHGEDRSGRKGVDLLYGAMRHLIGKGIDAHGVIFGRSAPENPPDVGLPLHWTGRLNDDITLALLYSAADVMVVPSRMDNLPQTGTEAQSCGCPVVAFRIGGLPDIVEHKKTGYLAAPFDTEDLAIGIRWVIEDPARTATLSAAARARALSEWDTVGLVNRYQSTYQAAIDTFHAK
jgi:glycosyltransferase involved in cell wall biosynthesis